MIFLFHCRHLLQSLRLKFTKTNLDLFQVKGFNIKIKISEKKIVSTFLAYLDLNGSLNWIICKEIRKREIHLLNIINILRAACFDWHLIQCVVNYKLQAHHLMRLNQFKFCHIIFKREEEKNYELSSRTLPSFFFFFVDEIEWKYKLWNVK